MREDMKDNALNKLIHPIWKVIVLLIVVIIPAIHNWLSIIRDEVLPVNLRSHFTLKGIFREMFMISWYWWVIIGLIIFIILKTLKEVKKENISFAQICTGKWRNTWIDKNGNTDYEIFEIRNNNEYHVFQKEKTNGKHVHDHHRFNIEISKYDGKEIVFIKNWVNLDWHPYKNFLQIKSPTRLEGKETNGSTVIYTKEE
jgi:hypothetical protein